MALSGFVPLPSDNRSALIARFEEADDAFKKWREHRTECLKAVVEAYSSAGELMSGTERVAIGQGYEVKIIHSVTYELDKTDDYGRVEKALDEIERTVEYGGLIAERLTRRKVELSKSEYDKLPPAAKKIIDRVITVKPGAKTVEIVKEK